MSINDVYTVCQAIKIYLKDILTSFNTIIIEKLLKLDSYYFVRTINGQNKMN